MAEFKGIIGNILGRLGNYVYSFQKGTYYVKAHNPTPTNPNTYRQQQVRAHMKNLSQHWVNLTSVQKDLWNNFATMFPNPITGYNAFQMLNMHLLAACHTDLGCIYTPPPFPSTPKFPLGFCVFAMTLTVVCVTWTRPHTVADYITCYFRLHDSFCVNNPLYGLCPTDGYRSSPRFIGTIRSDVTEIVHNHSWPGGAQLYYKIRSIDKYGRQSPFSHELRLIAPDA